MKVKLNVGAEFDVLSKDELDDSLKQSAKDFARLVSDGIRYGKSSVSNINSIGLPTSPTYTGGYVQLPVGPNPGYVWSIKNLTFFNAPANSADLLINGFNNGDAVYAQFTNGFTSGTTIISSNGVIVQAGNDLFVGFRSVVTNFSMNLYYEEVKLEDIGKL